MPPPSPPQVYHDYEDREDDDDTVEEGGGDGEDEDDDGVEWMVDDGKTIEKRTRQEKRGICPFIIDSVRLVHINGTRELTRDDVDSILASFVEAHFA